MNKPALTPSTGAPSLWRRYLPPLVFLGWWEMFIRLLGGGTYQNYLHPKLGWLILLGWTITGLFVVGLLTALLARRKGVVPRSTAEALVLVLPLFYVLIGTDTGLRSGALSGRVLWNVFEGLPPVSAPALPAGGHGSPATEMNLLQVSNMASGKTSPTPCVATSGMYYRDHKAPGGAFVLFRYVLSCCAADAQPVIIPVRTQIREEFTNDTWVGVEGAVSIFTNARGVAIPLIEATRTQCIPVPPRNEQYLYPMMGW